MKKLFAFSLIALCSCGGSLSDEQRKKFREGMEENKIVRVSDSEIVSEALDKGQNIYAILQRSQFKKSTIDSIENVNYARIRWLVPGQGNADEIEQQLIEAYVLGMATGSVQDNVQKIWKTTGQQNYDSLVYSKPVVTKLPDGTDKLEGIWNVYLSRKQIVLELSRKK